MGEKLGGRGHPRLGRQRGVVTVVVVIVRDFTAGLLGGRG